MKSFIIDTSGSLKVNLTTEEVKEIKALKTIKKREVAFRMLTRKKLNALNALGIEANIKFNNIYPDNIDSDSDWRLIHSC